jgi:hypothetical protein
MLITADDTSSNRRKLYSRTGAGTRNSTDRKISTQQLQCGAVRMSNCLYSQFMWHGVLSEEQYFRSHNFIEWHVMRMWLRHRPEQQEVLGRSYDAYFSSNASNSIVRLTKNYKLIIIMIITTTIIIIQFNGAFTCKMFTCRPTHSNYVKYAR